MMMMMMCSALFVVTLVFTGIGLHRHRKAGGHCTPNSGGGNAQVQPQNETAQPHEELPAPLFAAV
jgi:hypothetical protein